MKSITDVQHLRQMSLLAFERSRSKDKVKVQGQSRCTENLALVLARLWFIHQIWQSDISIIGTKYDLSTTSKIVAWLWFARSECFS